MTRTFVGSCLLLSALIVTSQAYGDDVVSYLKKANKIEVTGKIEKEGPEGLRLKSSKTTLDIPAMDVVQIVYDQRKMTVATFRPPFSALEKALVSTRVDPKELAATLKDLERLLPQFRDVPAIDRHIQYSICQATLLQGRDDPQRKAEAIRLLEAFRLAHKDGWQLLPALKSLAELQQEKGDVDGALKTCEQLAGIAAAPREVKIFADLQMGQLLMLRARYTDAEARWLTLLDAKGLPDDAPERAYCKVYLQRCRLALNKPDGVEGELRTALKGPDDAKLRALVHNTLGDFYRTKGDKEEAFWNYLRVEVLYPQDGVEEAHALYYLGELFDTVKNDPMRGQECLEKLRREERFRGSEYRQRAEAEKK